MGMVTLLASLSGVSEAKGDKRAALPAWTERAKPFQTCLQHAASTYQLPVRLLAAIVHVENGEWNPLAVSINYRGKGIVQTVRSHQEAVMLVTRLWKQNVSFDVGLGQVNTVNMERYRVHPVALLDPCTNLTYSARILRESIDRHGYNWKAIERYNGINAQYPWKVKKALDLFR
jgi:soluble lytic murein transglycosylase-like protein